MTQITIEEVEQMLSNHRFQVMQTIRLNRKVEEIRRITQSPNTSQFEFDVSQGKVITLGERIATLVDLENDLLKQIIDLQPTINHIETAISKIEDKKFAMILRFYYIDGRTIDYIARVMYYNNNTVKKYKAKAIELLQSVINGNLFPPLI
jgi:DNA-directed RNA polymerase specialized sigma subunit